MREIVTLKTGDGCRISIVLDNRNSGLDDILRRWIFEDPYWRCIDNGQLAEQSGSAGTAAQPRGPGAG
jgi:hypothetical protein